MSATRRRWVLVALAAAVGLASGTVTHAQAGRGTGSRSALARGVLAIRNVGVVALTSDTVQAGMTVLAIEGRITAVGPAARVAVPRGAHVVDGTGRYLIPGLSDMHAHLLSDGEDVHDSAGPAELGVMVANGVTSVRLMMGTPAQLRLRADVAAGRILGPNLWVASPQLTGRPAEHAIVVTNAEEARAAVRAARDAGYDFIKQTLFITPEVFDAIVSEARAAGIRVVGHVDPAVGLTRALAARTQLEHLDSFFEEALADSAPSRASVTQQFVYALRNWVSLDHIDDRKVRQIAGATARAGVFVTPTQNVFTTAFAIGETDEAIRGRPDWGFFPQTTKDNYMRVRERYWNAASQEVRTPERRRRYVQVRNQIIKAIQDSGGRLMAGSDTPEWFHMYGWGLHRELQALVAAGLTPFQALTAATRTPAEFLGASAEWGTIEPGKRADFVLVSGNPLADIRNTMKIEGVASGGRWMDRRELDAMIARGRSAVAVGGA